MKRRANRIISMILVMAIVLGLLPVFTIPKAEAAASNIVGTFEGQDADVFSALGFDTTEIPEGYEADTTENPTGKDKSVGNQVFELLRSSPAGIKISGLDDNDVNPADIKGDISTSTGVPGNPFEMFTSAAGDFDGDGLPGEVVYVGFPEVDYYLTNGNTYSYAKPYMVIYDTKDGSYTQGTTLDLLPDKQGVTPMESVDDISWALYQGENDYAWQNLLQVTAGDYDGDGISEIAVYIADYTNPRVDIYKYQKTSQSKEDDWLRGNNWSRVWSYAVGQGGGGQLPNMVSLVTGDFDRDGVDDLGVAVGQASFHINVNQNGRVDENQISKSTARILWGSKTKMLQAMTDLDLNEDELGGDLARVSLITGDLDGDGYKELIATGQNLAELQTYRGTYNQEVETGNMTRTMTSYIWDGEALVINQSYVFKPIEGEIITTELEGNTTRTWKGNGFDNVYHSAPLMKTNAAVIKPDGKDYPYLYLDSCLYEAVEGQLQLRMSLDDEKYDQESTLGGDGKWIRKDAKNSGLKPTAGIYVEYGAKAEDINGRGNSILATSSYSNVSYAHRTRASGSSEITVKNQHSTGYSILYGDGNGGLATRVQVKDTKNENVSTVTINPYDVLFVDADIDTTIIEYTGDHYLTYSDPKVLAIIAAAPYFEDVDVISDYDYAWQNSTSYSRVNGEGHSEHVSVDLEAGAWMSADVTVTGGKIVTEFAMLVTYEWSQETSKTTEYTLTFDTSQDEDAVAFFSIPTENYIYNVYTANGSGGYDVTQEIISRTFTPCYQVLNLDYYESIQGNYDSLPAIRGEALQSTPGDPSSYPASASGYDVIAQWNDYAAGVSFGNGSITQEISITEEEAESYNLGAALDFAAGGGVGMQSDLAQSDVEVAAGVQFSMNPSGGWTDIDITGTVFSGTVANMPLEFQDYGYYYSWKLFAYNYEFQGNSIPVVSYLVGDVSEPPQLPEDFQQDFDRTTAHKNVLTWTYDGAFSSFKIYKYFDFPVGGGLQLVETIPASTANYTLLYDEEGKPYKQYFFEDDNLAAYSEYQYAIQVERLSATPPLSAPSGLLTVRTKAADGYPLMPISESDAENDGRLLVYPDKTAYLTVNATGPKGEIRDEYYSVVQYQWQKMEKGAWTDLVNETSMTLTFASAGVDTEGTYRCRVNVLTKADNTGISAYTDPIEVTHSKRTTYIDGLAAKDISGGGLELYAKVINAHSDSGTIPSGTVTFTLTDNATGKTYQTFSKLSASGIATKVMVGSLPEGMYTVEAYYSGSYIFKSSEADSLYLSQKSYGYDIEVPDPLIFGDENQITFRYVTKEEGYTIATPVNADTYATYFAQKAQLKPLDNAVEIKAGDTPTAGTNYYYVDDGMTWYFTGSFMTGDVFDFEGQYVLYDLWGTDLLTLTAEEGVYDLADNTSVGLWVAVMTGPNGKAVAPLNIQKRDITIQLPDLQWAEGSNQYPGLPTFSDLETIQVVDGSWAPYHLENPDVLQYYSMEPVFYNTAGKQMDKEQVIKTCGYYTMTCSGYIANYNVRYLDGSVVVLGAVHKVSIGTRYFEDQQVGTVYAISPTYGSTRNNLKVASPFYQAHQTGTRMVFMAAPDEGYEVYDWYINGVAQNNQKNMLAYVLLNEDTTVEVQFAIKQNSLEFGTAGDEGGGTIVCSDPAFVSGSYVISNSRFDFEAVANPGYHFKEWRYTEQGKGTSYYTEDEGQMESRFQLQMPMVSCSVYAVFERDYYTFDYEDLSGAGGLTAWYYGTTTTDSTAQKEAIPIQAGQLVKGDTMITVGPAAGYTFDTEYRYVSTGTQGVANYSEGTYMLLLREDTKVTGYTQRQYFDVNLQYEVTQKSDEAFEPVITITGEGISQTVTYPDTEETSIQSVPGGSDLKFSITYPSYYNFRGWAIDDNIFLATREVNRLAVPVEYDGVVKKGVAYRYATTNADGVTVDYYFTATATGVMRYFGDAVIIYLTENEITLEDVANASRVQAVLEEKDLFVVDLGSIYNQGTYTLNASGGEFKLPDGASHVGDLMIWPLTKASIQLHRGDDLTFMVEANDGHTVSYWECTPEGGETVKVRATSLKYTIPDIQSNYKVQPIFSASTYNTISWPTLGEAKNGVVVEPLEGYLTSVASGSDFVFRLTGPAAKLIKNVYANGIPVQDSAKAGDDHSFVIDNVDGNDSLDYIYRIRNIRENTEITVEFYPVGYTVNGVDVNQMFGSGWAYDIATETLTLTKGGLTLSGSADRTLETNELFAQDIYSAQDFHIVAEDGVGSVIFDSLIIHRKVEGATTPMFHAKSTELLIKLIGNSQLDNNGGLDHLESIMFTNGNLLVGGFGTLSLLRDVNLDRDEEPKAALHVREDLTLVDGARLEVQTRGRLGGAVIEHSEYTNADNTAILVGGSTYVGQANMDYEPMLLSETNSGRGHCMDTGNLYVYGGWVGLEGVSQYSPLECFGQVYLYGGVVELFGKTTGIYLTEGKNVMPDDADFRAYYPNGYVMVHEDRLDEHTETSITAGFTTRHVSQYSNGTYHDMGDAYNYRKIRIMPMGDVKTTDPDQLYIKVVDRLSGNSAEYTFRVSGVDDYANDLAHVVYSSGTLRLTSSPNSSESIIATMQNMGDGSYNLQVVPENDRPYEVTISTYCKDLSVSNWGGTSDNVLILDNCVIREYQINQYDDYQFRGNNYFLSPDEVAFNLRGSGSGVKRLQDADQDGTATLTAITLGSGKTAGILPNVVFYGLTDATFITMDPERRQNKAVEFQGLDANRKTIDYVDPMLHGDGVLLDYFGTVWGWEDGNSMGASVIAATVDEKMDGDYLWFRGLSRIADANPNELTFDKTNPYNPRQSVTTTTLQHPILQGAMYRFARENITDGQNYAWVEILDALGKTAVASDGSTYRLVVSDEQEAWMGDGSYGDDGTFHLIPSQAKVEANSALAVYEEFLQNLPNGQYTVRVGFSQYGGTPFDIRDWDQYLDIPLTVYDSGTVTGDLDVRLSQDAVYPGGRIYIYPTYNGDQEDVTFSYLVEPDTGDREHDTWLVQPGGQEYDAYLPISPNEAAQGFTITCRAISRGSIVAETQVRIEVVEELMSVDLVVANSQVIQQEDGSYLVRNVQPDGEPIQATVRSFYETTPEQEVLDLIPTVTLWGNQRAGTILEADPDPNMPRQHLLTISPKETGTDNRLKLTVSFTDKMGKTLEKTVVLNLSTEAHVSYVNDENANGSILALFAGDTLMDATGGWVEAGTVITVEAAANEGYMLSGWLVNGEPISAQDGYVMDWDNGKLTFEAKERGMYQISARFDSTEGHALHYSATGKGTISALSEGRPVGSGQQVLTGKNVTLTATPDAYHYIVGWTVDGEAWLVDGEAYTGNTLTLENVTEEHTVSVEFAAQAVALTLVSQAPDAAAPQGDLTLVVNGQPVAMESNTTGATTTYTYVAKAQDQVTILATAKGSFRVRSWEVDGTPVKDSAGMTSYALGALTQPVNVTVTFAPVPTATVTITNNSFLHGAGVVLAQDQRVEVGGSTQITVGLHETLTLTALPELGSSHRWEVEGAAYGESGNSLTLLDITGNVTVYAVFTSQTYDVAVETVDGGRLTVGYIQDALEQTLEEGNTAGIPAGTDLTITAKAEAGSYLTALTVNGEAVETAWNEADGTYTYDLALQKDLTISATFAPVPRKVNVTVPTIFTDTVKGETLTSGTATIHHVPDGFSGDADTTDGQVEVALGGSAILAFAPAEGYYLDLDALTQSVSQVLTLLNSKATFTVQAQAGACQVTILGVDMALDFTAMASPFKPLEVNHTVTITQPEHGTLKVYLNSAEILSGAQVPEGSILTIVATAEEHFALESVLNNGTPVVGDTITVLGDVNLSATFQATEYLLTVKHTGPGSVLINGTAYSENAAFYVPANSNVTLAYSYNTDLVDLTASQEAGTFTMSGPKTLEAVFVTNRAYVHVEEPANASLAVFANGQMVQSGDAVAIGTELTLVATPHEHYALKELKANGTVLSANTFTLTEETTFTATFEATEYLVSLNVTGPGQVFLNGQQYLDGDNFYAPVGSDLVIAYQYDSTLVELSTNYPAGSYTVEGPMAIGATFQTRRARVSYAQPEGGHIQVYAGDQILSSGALVELGTTLRVVAVPDEHYRLDWIKNGAETLTGDTITVTEDVNLTAAFVPTEFLLDLQVEGIGTVLINGTAYTEDTLLYLPADQDYTVAYEYDAVLWDLATTHDAGTYTMTAPATLKATFTLTRAYVTFDQPEHGTLQVFLGDRELTSGEAVELGMELLLVATPQEHYHLKSLSVNGMVLGGNTYTLTGQSHFTAEFTDAEFALNLNISGPGVVVVNDIRYTQDTTLYLPADSTFTISYEYDEALVDLTTDLTAGSYTMAADRTVSVTFTTARTYVHVEESANGTLAVFAGDQEIHSGDTVALGTTLTLVATADEHFGLKAITANGVVVDGTTYVLNTETRFAAEFAPAEYQVTLNLAGTGAVLINGIRYEESTSFYLPADEDFTVAYEYDTTLGDLTTTHEAGTYTLTGPVTINAAFAVTRAFVTFDQPENGKLQVFRGDQELQSGDTVALGATLTLVATPDAHYGIQQLSAGDFVLEGNTVEILGDTVLAAQFARTEYEMTLNHTGPGVVILNGQEYTESASIWLKAGNSYTLDYRFDGILVDLTANIAAGTHALVEDTTLDVVFTTNRAYVTFDQPEHGAFHVLLEGKDIVSGDVIDIGAELQLVALPLDHYGLVHYAANGSALAGDRYTVAEGRNHLTALLARTEYSVTWTDTNGRICVTLDGAPVDNGQYVPVGAKLTITAEANLGYRLVDLTVTGAEEEDGFYVARDDMVITAAYEVKTFQLHLRPGLHGTIAVTDGERSYTDGDDIQEGTVLTITALPEEGYEVASFLVNDQTADSGIQITMLDTTVVAATFRMSPVAGALPYYLDEDGNRIFLGFSYDLDGDGLIGYEEFIAPEGAEILYGQNPKSFTDIQNHWGKDSILFAAQRELFNGITATTFGPEQTLTRAMFVTVLGRLYERSYGQIEAAAEGTFTDCNYNDYYGKYVDWAQRNGIIQGYGDGAFGPHHNITREQMAVVLYNFAKFMGRVPQDMDTQLLYADGDTIAPWAREAALFCQTTGLIQGMGGNVFAPRFNAKRAEMAVITIRMIQYILEG